MSLSYSSPRHNNKHSNVQLQFLSLCRLQQLAMPSGLTVGLASLLLQRPAVKLWLLLLVILQARVSTTCHVKCWESCYPSRCHVACSSEPIDNISSVYSSIDQEFKPHYKSITYLKNDSFISKGLKELKKLSLNHCGLEALEFGAFNGVTKLTRLSLQHNELREIIPCTFEKNIRLNYLDLSHNRIEHLNGNEFSGLVNLNYVNLTNNQLRTIHSHLFVGLNNIKKNRFVK